MRRFRARERARCHSLRAGANPQLRPSATRIDARHRDRNPPRRRSRPSPHSRRPRRLLCAGRQISACRLRQHERFDRQSRGRQARHRLHAAFWRQARARSRGRDGDGRRGRDLLHRRRAGDCGDGFRAAGRKACRFNRRAGQRLRRRSQAAIVRARRPRFAGRAHRNACHRRRDLRCRIGRRRFAGASRARADLAFHAFDDRRKTRARLAGRNRAPVARGCRRPPSPAKRGTIAARLCCAIPTKK